MSRKSESSSIKSIYKRTPKHINSRDPVYFLAKSLIYTIHISHASKLSIEQSSHRLGSGIHKALEAQMYETVTHTKDSSLEYIQSCHKLYSDVIGEFLSFNHYVELLISQFMDKRLMKKMRSENYEQYFSSIIKVAGTNYITELKSRVPTLYAYESTAVYVEPCTKLMYEKLYSAFEISSHRLTDDSCDNVPLAVYETIRDDRNRLLDEVKRLRKKIRKLKDRLESS